MASETDPYQEGEQADAAKLQQAMFVGRYHPSVGRADRSAANIPGGHTSSFGSNGDKMTGTGLGGSNH